MKIRLFEESDWAQVWPMIEAVFRAGETYPTPTDVSESDARHYWIESAQQTWVAENDGATIIGSYYIKPNQTGLGSHVCNCGYIVAETARGQGIASSLCVHSQATAVELGFRAMQYNLVVSTNAAAIHVWKKHGMQVVGVLPKAFNSQSAGYVDALVMYKQLLT